MSTGYGNDGEDGVTSGRRAAEAAIGASAGGGNVVQLNVLSYNIFNPQVAIGGNNTSNNMTLNNVAADNGNNSRARSASGGGAWLGSMIGNGNVVQLAFGSGNIYNPQFSIGGENISNNVAVTNLSVDNGNDSDTETHVTAGALGYGVLGGLIGNGNTFQAAALSSNIINPQFSTGNGNTSNNTATTNDATRNGNGSTTLGTVAGGSSGLYVGMSGNGNTMQSAAGSSNIYNDQWNVGISTGRRPSGTTPQPQPYDLDPGVYGDDDSGQDDTASTDVTTQAASTTRRGRTDDADPILVERDRPQQRLRSASAGAAGVTNSAGPAPGTNAGSAGNSGGTTVSRGATKAPQAAKPAGRSPSTGSGPSNDTGGSPGSDD
ncbi:hypothetical protein [Mycolicibacterium sediminis]|uniref:hypothetical protein n=1 Tax=Mycolicibacterium sediminis TaxID=1286180 RepID=UPI0013D694A6|nr:hypothetical protein [Mycolicibacterium sediminis]